jgi:rod shape-determining protein MreD
MNAWRLLLLGVLAVAVKTGLALVPPLAPLADPLLVVAVLAALSGRRWPAMLTGLATGVLDDALFGQWLGVHAFSQMTIAFVLALIAVRVDMLQAPAVLLAVATASLADWGIQAGLAALFDRSVDVVPGPLVWIGAAIVNTAIGFFFFRIGARRRSGL